MNVSFVNCRRQVVDLSADISRSAVRAFKQQRLKPAIELFNGTQGVS